ncbi:N-glycosylase/DNA lyase [Tolypocladium paradoxum]|uniref:DNA-(apurinic or apyrimidinic site) lyase n=1 Tax=Tolypocladium paradoxum TaxID=94208 RepID=A0A2S4KKY2_9HYPO|nr:N-glycosylase/DNA lyase [Tolypocladium paradoxum]
MAMAIKRASEWHKLPVTFSELCIDTTLRCGQSFRWRKVNDAWTCTLHGRILSLKQDPEHLHYKVTWPETPLATLVPPPSNGAGLQGQDDTEELLRRYFSLSLDLGALYKQWSGADANFRKRAPEFAGVRILSQDAWEALVCFICSSNNNISRISQMVHKLCKHYGPVIGHVGDEALHDFPTPDSLTGKQVESRLRELGFGYRAKYIAETARVVAQEKPPLWLESLRNPEHQGLQSRSGPESLKSTYKEAHEALLSLTGVGPKVADCVCLMGLGWGESVPVDTHVWQIAQRDYKFGKTKSKTFNKAMYDAVGDHFRGIWGQYAGWAHSVLFAADLREFSDRKVKKEDVQRLVETQTSVIEDEAATRRRKRSATLKTVTTEVKVDDTKDGVLLEVDRVFKRRRTRQRP